MSHIEGPDDGSGDDPLETTVQRVLVALAVGAGLFLCLFPVDAAESDLRVINDRGGDVALYQRRVETIRASGGRVVIDGPCESACALYLTLPPAQLCATSRGSFGFHTATDSRTGLPIASENDRLLALYPAPVRNWIIGQGGLWLNVLRTPARRFVRACAARGTP